MWVEMVTQLDIAVLATDIVDQTMVASVLLANTCSNLLHATEPGMQ
jgi:hypothetical protein